MEDRLSSLQNFQFRTLDIHHEQVELPEVQGQVRQASHQHLLSSGETDIRMFLQVKLGWQQG
jgi:hypothetical protein